MRKHQRIDKSYGNGYSEPREHWVVCSCGALIWAWQQFYEGNPTDPDDAWNAHLQGLTAAPIKVWVGPVGWAWFSCEPCGRAFDIVQGIAAAADAGRAHLADHHTAQMPPATYCRTHGTRSDDCGCQMALGDTQDVGGPENGLQRSSAALQRLFDTTRSDS